MAETEITEAEPVSAPEPVSEVIAEPVPPEVAAPAPEVQAAPDVAPAAEVAPAPAPASKVSLESWIGRQFNATKQAALLGGFQHEEIALKRFHDTAANYAARLEAFAGRPSHENKV